MKYTREKIPQKIELKGREVPYTLILSNRARRLSLKIGQESGLEVVVPRRYNLSKVPRFIHEKENWILKHLENREQIRQKRSKNRIKDGTAIKICGEPYTIRILPTRKKKPFVKEARALKYSSDVAYFDGAEILIYLPKTTPLADLHKLAKQSLEKHLRTKAKKIFTRRTRELAELMGLTFNRISIKAQKTRWGSCSRDKNLNFNWRLILTEPEVLDSIIIHELAHLKYLNHGKRFYALVEQHCPDHKELNKKLREAEFII